MGVGWLFRKKLAGTGGSYVTLRVDFYAGIAQLVEQLICNQPVAGSSPISSSNIIKGLGYHDLSLFYFR